MSKHSSGLLMKKIWNGSWWHWPLKKTSSWFEEEPQAFFSSLSNLTFHQSLFCFEHRFSHIYIFTSSKCSWCQLLSIQKRGANTSALVASKLFAQDPITSHSIPSDFRMSPVGYHTNAKYCVCVGWKRPLKSSGPSINPTLPCPLH